MLLTDHAKTILLAILAETKRLESLAGNVPAEINRDQRAVLSRRRSEYLRFGVPHDLARWLGHVPTPAESAVFSRTLRNMEAAGLVERVSRWGGRRTTHVRLTAFGRAEAQRLADEREAFVDEVMDGVLCDLESDL
jgi:hypothetical protein